MPARILQVGFDETYQKVLTTETIDNPHEPEGGASDGYYRHNKHTDDWQTSATNNSTPHVKTNSREQLVQSRVPS